MTHRHHFFPQVFPVFWGFMKSFLDPSTRARIEIFGAAPSPRDLFQPGGWPARVRQLLGYFPDVFYPHLRSGKVPRSIAWEDPPWTVLGETIDRSLRCFLPL